VFSALNYIHNNKIVHRDLKPENILLKSEQDLTVKIMDFGLSTYYKEPLKLSTGTPVYMSPEMFEDGETHD